MFAKKINPGEIVYMTLLKFQIFEVEAANSQFNFLTMGERVRFFRKWN
jgi:hypothetical protein